MPDIHERFDLPRWIREFHLVALQDEARRWVAQQTGPIDDPEPASFEQHCPLVIDGPRGLAAIESIRAAFGTHTLGPPTATDVFVWATGEPANPAATKIGGVPYRLAATAWPKRPDGGAMAFLAQFCFADSRDLQLTPKRLLGSARPLPGDVLLIFAPGDYLADWDDDEPKSLVFEWQPLGLTGLIRPGDIPAPPIPLAPLHAQIHRTLDYLRPPNGHPIYNLYDGKRIAILSGSKIGGVPAWSQGSAKLAGAHLCTLASVNAGDETHPFVNSSSTGRAARVPDHLLMLADLGLLYLFVDKVGAIRWTVQGG